MRHIVDEVIFISVTFFWRNITYIVKTKVTNRMMVKANAGIIIRAVPTNRNSYPENESSQCRFYPQGHYGTTPGSMNSLFLSPRNPASVYLPSVIGSHREMIRNTDSVIFKRITDVLIQQFEINPLFQGFLTRFIQDSVYYFVKQTLMIYIRILHILLKRPWWPRQSNYYASIRNTFGIVEGCFTIVCNSKSEIYLFSPVCNSYTVARIYSTDYPAHIKSLGKEPNSGLNCPA